MDTLDLFTTNIEKPPQFDGAVYDSKKDWARLSGQILRIWRIIQDGKWRTVEEINSRIMVEHSHYDPECSISAQLRNLRKERFGGHIIEKRRRGEEESALWEYRLQPKEEQ